MSLYCKNMLGCNRGWGLVLLIAQLNLIEQAAAFLSFKLHYLSVYNHLSDTGWVGASPS